MNKLLDLKDKRILFELEQDSRQSLNQLAKKVGLKKETIFHRIKKLEQKGIIKRYLAEIDVYKLGYQYYPMLIRFQNTSPAKEQEIYKYIEKSSYTAWLTKCEGAWDLNLTLIAKENFELNQFLEKFLEKYSKYISEKNIFLSTEVHYFKRGFWLNKEKTQVITIEGNYKVKVDDIDIKLLKIISTQARKPLVEIGNKLHINSKKVAYRIRRLEKEGIIQGSKILVDFSKMGYKFYKVWFSFKDLTNENYKKIMNYFNQSQNIIWATKLIGSYDFSIEMEVKDVEEFRKILDDIKLKFSHLIKKHESLLIFEEAIMNYLP